MQFGTDGHLVGLLATPESDRAAPRVAVIILNAGVLHRVGPHRLHVNLARRLATSGIMSLRFDLSGIGDSGHVSGAPSFTDSAVVDVKSAMDWLGRERAADRFVLFGICSGADNALATATADERVVGLVLLDPPAYATMRARVRKLFARLRRLASPGAVAAWLARRVRYRRPSTVSEPSGGREVPSVTEYRALLTTLTERGIAILAVFSGALGAAYNHPDQLFELFPELRGKIDRAFFPAANHTFTEVEAQTALVTVVSEWIERRR